MAPKAKFRKIVIQIPPLTFRKWRPPHRPHVPKPFKRKPITRKPIFPQTRKIPHSSLAKIWHYYKIFTKNIAILMGTFSHNDHRYPPKTRGKQGPANCFVAIGYTKVKEMDKWNSDSVDGILTNGYRLYLMSLAINKNACDCTAPKEVHNNFYIECNNVILIVDDDTPKGNLFREEDDDEKKYFKKELRKAFKRTNYVIVEVEGKFFAVWKLKGSYYIFDPNDRDRYANRVREGEGKSVVLKFVEYFRLVDHCQTTLSPFGQNKAFTITLITIKKFVKVDFTPPDNFEFPIRIRPPFVPRSCIASKLPPLPKPWENLPEFPLDIKSKKGKKGKKGKKKKKKEEEEFVGIDYTKSNLPSMPDLMNPDKIKTMPFVIPKEKPVPPPVSYYTPLIGDISGILLGSCHQGCDKCTQFAGKQSLGNAIAAIAMLGQFKSKFWYSRMIDEILLTGETIYIDSKENFCGYQDLTLKNVVNKFKLNRKYYCHDIEEVTVVGQLGSEKLNILHLNAALKEFFTDHDTGILRGPIVVAIWYEEGKYYMFDPHKRDEQGKKIDPEYSLENPKEMLPSPPGTACVTWFVNLDDLVQLYTWNLPREAKREYFYISKIQIKDYIEIPEAWHHFTPLKVDKYILIGTISQNNSRFANTSRNSQCTCMAVLAVAIAQMKPVPTWDRDQVDDIVITGDVYYNQTVDNLKKKNKYVQRHLFLNEANRYFNYGNNMLKLNIQECVVNGGLILKDSNLDIPNIKKGLELFFRDYDYGVITSRGVSVGFWIFENHYFLFDSHGKDDQGYNHPGGTACVYRFNSILAMVNVLLANLKPQGADYYNIGSVEATILEKSEGYVKPQFFQYLELSPKKGIIRASFNQGDDKFDIRADKQTIPNLLTALAMASVLPSYLWTPSVLDQILMLGDKLYDDSRREVILTDLDKYAEWDKEEKVPDLDTVNTKNVFKQVQIGLNVINFDIQTPKDGIFEPYKVRRNRHGNVIYQANELQNLLWNAIEDSKDGTVTNKKIIIESEHIHLAVWKQDGIYYVFDPKGKDTEGNWYGRDLWSAKIIIMDEDYGGMGEAEMFYGMGDQGASIPTSSKASKVQTEDEDEDEDEEFLCATLIRNFDISDAKACAIMFGTFDDLYTHIMENVRPNKRAEGLKIYQINLISKVAVKPVTNIQNKAEGNWFNFEEIERDSRWILRGTMNFTHSIFPAINRGKQYGSMCVAACVYCRLFALPKFKSTTVDGILKYGDKLHTAVLRGTENELKKHREQAGLTDEEIYDILSKIEITATETLMEFLIGDYYVNLSMRPSVVEGDITLLERVPGGVEAKEKAAAAAAAAAAAEAPKPEPELTIKRSRRRLGSVRSRASISILDFSPVAKEEPTAVKGSVVDEPKLSTLNEGLTFYFKHKTFGVLNAKNKSIAVWNIGHCFYLFDPDARGPSGLKECYGCAHIMRFVSLDHMTTIIRNNMPKDGSNVFKIDSITIRSRPALRPAPEIPFNKPPKIPGKIITTFREITEEKLIMRGNFHQDNPKFSIPPGAASACNAIVAIAMSEIHPTDSWSKPIIDDIIINALRLYKQSRMTLGYSFNEWEDIMKVELINKEFKVGVVSVKWSVNSDGIQQGILCIKDPKIPNLRRGCEEFFQQHNRGIIESLPLTVGIWIQKELIYMFDPNPRGAAGIYATGGTACTILCKTVKELVEHYLKNVPIEMQQDDFAIYPIDINTLETRPKKRILMKKSQILKVKEIDSLFGFVESKRDLIKRVKKLIIKPDPFYCDKPKPKPRKKGPKSRRSKREKSTKLPCCCPDRNKLIPQEKIIIDESKFNIEEKKKWAREKSEAKRLKELHLKEHRLRAMFFTLDNGDGIVRGHYSQNSSKFSPLSRNQQTYANALVCIVMSKLHEPKTWSYKNIEIILESGDVLYKDSYMKYRPKNKLLGLRNLLRTFFIYHLKITTAIFKPFIFGDCQHEDLYIGLLNFFMQETAGILVTEGDLLVVAVFQKSGQYYMFDPHDRDFKGNVTCCCLGCACLLRFDHVENLVEKYLNIIEVPEEAERIPRFSICAVAIEEVERITK